MNASVTPFPTPPNQNPAGLSREEEIADGARFAAEVAMSTANYSPRLALHVLKRAARTILQGGGYPEEEYDVEGAP